MTPVTQCDVPLVAETLPALKVRYYSEMAEDVYTFARMYVLQDSLSVSLYKFERTPPSASRLAFAVAAAEGPKVLFASVGPQQSGFCNVALCDGAGALPPCKEAVALEAPTPTWFGGVDEQGWYWGAEVVLSAEVLAQAGCILRPGAMYCAAVFCYAEGEEGIGASFPLPKEGPVVMNGAEKFSVVIY